MMRRYITALMLACCIGGYGQEKKQVTFVPPFDFPLTLSGNFGEIRSITSTADWILRQAELSVNPFVLSLMAIFRVFASRMVRDMYLMSVITMAIQRSTAI